MSDNEKENVMNLFRSNVKGYMGINDIQETITCVTYLFWNAKYVVKNSFEVKDQKSIEKYLQSHTSENEKLIWNVCNNIRPVIAEANLYNICKTLNNYTEEELINIIIDDYGLYSRYNIGTPDSINELVFQILEKENVGKDILDICSFTGNFLTYYAKKNKNYNYSGIEINGRSNLIAKLRLNVLKVKNQLFNDNVFSIKTTNKYDKIFCNYPIGVRLEDVAVNLLNKTNNKIKFDFTNKTSSCWAFINVVINFLKENGKAIVVMHNANLTSLKNSDLEYRKLLVDGGYVESAILLPESLFANTSIPVTLLVLSNKNKTIKFINAEKMVQSNNLCRAMNSLSIDEIMKEYSVSENSVNTQIVDCKDLKDNNYSLFAKNYMNMERFEVKNPKELNEICSEIYRGYQISANEINQNSEPKEDCKEYKIVNITNIIDGVIEKDLNKIYLDNDKLDKYILKDKDLLVSSKGNLSKYAVVELKDNEKLLPSGNFSILRLDTKLINPYYLKMFFESDKGNAIINLIKSGNALPSINLSQLKKIKVPVPSIEEQNKIVNKYLAKLDEITILKLKLKRIEESLTEIKNEEF